jgi:hypothetical protein
MRKMQRGNGVKIENLKFSIWRFVLRNFAFRTKVSGLWKGAGL